MAELVALHFAGSLFLDRGHSSSGFSTFRSSSTATSFKQATGSSSAALRFPARRAVIYDRNGKKLAMTVAVDSIFALPSEIPDQANTAALLARILRTEPQEVLARFKVVTRLFLIARKVDTIPLRASAT